MILKDLSNAKVICVDIETYDPGIAVDLGPGVYRNDGYILGVSLADDTGWSEYLNLGHYDVDRQERADNVEYLHKVLALPCPKLGTNIKYDCDWLQNWTGDTAKFGFRGEGVVITVNGKWYDIQVAEALIDENQGQYNLDFLANKYLGIGKFKDEISKFYEDNNLKGDERRWLYKMPYELVRKYAIADVLEPVAIFRKQWTILSNENLMEVFALETDLLPSTLDMRKQGAIIDTKVRDVNAFLATCEKETRAQKLRNSFGNVNFNSTKQLAELFDKEGIPYNYKVCYTDVRKGDAEKVVNADTAKLIKTYMSSPASCGDTTMNKIHSVLGETMISIQTCNPTIGKEYLEGLEKQHEDGDEDDAKGLVADILFVRKADKMVGSFLQGSLKENLCPDGRIHPSINTTRTDDYGTRSGRFSMSNPNLQQIPSKSRDKYWGTMCREPFIPLQDCWWAKLDYSQIEYRCLAHFASGEGAKELVQRYNEDPHTDYHQYIVELTGLTRSFAKKLNFGCMYGMGIQHMSEFFNWGMDYAKEIMEIYHGNAPYIKTTMNTVATLAKGRGYIITLAGRRSRLVDTKKSYIMLNRLLQGSAADIMKKAMVDIYGSDVLNYITWHLTVHDELNYSVPKTAKAVRALFTSKNLMEHTYKLKVPVKAELELGKDWAHISDFGFDDTGISEQDWLDNLTDTNVVSQVETLVAQVKAIKDAKKK